MRMVYLAVTTMCFMLMTSPCVANEKKQQMQIDQQAMMEVWKKLATPGEPHKLFASLAGSWTTTAREWMEPGKPPTESTGTAEMKMLLDGRFLYQEYNGQITREKPAHTLAVMYDSCGLLSNGSGNSRTTSPNGNSTSICSSPKSKSCANHYKP